MRKISKHLVFTIGSVGLTFGILSLVRSENRQYQATISMQQRLRLALQKLNRDDSFFGKISRDLKHIWDQQSLGQKLAIGLIGVNAVIFGLWQIPRYSNFMHRYFVHDPASGRVLTHLTSCYSHQSLLHFSLNMYALYGFLPVLQFQSGMSWEQTFAFYNGACLLSSLASHITGVLLSRYRIIIPSLGASGGIWGVLAGTAIVAPHLKIGIIFIPGISQNISDFIPILMAFDAAGLLFGWRFFDHAAHLGGAVTGFLYLNYGRQVWNQFQDYLKSIKAKI